MLKKSWMTLLQETGREPVTVCVLTVALAGFVIENKLQKLDAGVPDLAQQQS